MFKPNSKLKKILSVYGNTAYAYNDGIVIIENAKARAKGHEFDTQLCHVIPCGIDIFVRSEFNRNPRSSNDWIGRIVFHNSSLLIDGIKNIDVYFGSCSESSKAKGIYSDNTTIHTLSGMRIRTENFDFYSSDITLQNDSVMTCHEFETNSNFYNSIIKYEIKDIAA